MLSGEGLGEKVNKNIGENKKKQYSKTLWGGPLGENQKKTWENWENQKKTKNLEKTKKNNIPRLFGEGPLEKIKKTLRKQKKTRENRKKQKNKKNNIPRLSKKPPNIAWFYILHSLISSHHHLCWLNPMIFLRVWEL